MNKYELVNKHKRNCSGCGLCAVRCPKKAITMKEDEYGFVYAYIDKSKCINCDLCRKICPYINPTDEEESLKESYVAVADDSNVLTSVASGGVFSAIAKKIIDTGGIVFGSILERSKNGFEVKHIKCSSIEELDLIKGSKYVQSSILKVYQDVSESLKDGKKVLFSGTPCQISAIKKYTNNPDNLYTIDIICHGVPNNTFFNNYIEFENKKNNIDIKDFKFRNKNKGWGLYYYYYYYYDLAKKKYFSKTKPAFNSSYYQLFLDCAIYRENCYSCNFANDKRTSDITIGDYWGIEKEHPELINSHSINPFKGVSCLIVNTKKGKKILDDYGKGLNIYSSSFEKIARHNQQLNHPSKMNKDREMILEGYKEDGYLFVNNYYKHSNVLKRIVKGIWYKIPYSIRKKIRK